MAAGRVCNVAVDKTARPRETERGSSGLNGWTSDEKKRVRLRTSRRVAGRFVSIGPEIGARVAHRARVLPLALVDSRGRRGAAGQLVLLHFIFHLSSGHFTLVCSVDFAFFSLPGRNLFLFFSNSHTTL